MPDRAFFDTNILIYAFSADDPRSEMALSLLLNGGTIGIQSLNEFANVNARKLKKPWTEIMARLATIQELCPSPVPITLSVHRRGLQIAQMLGYQVYDSLLLAAALEASCTIFYSEDMHDGQIIDTLTVRNPFQSRG